MDGIEAVTQLNYLHPHLPMSALTRHQQKIHLKGIITARCKGNIHKPQTYKDMFSVSEKVLNSKFVIPESLHLVLHLKQ